MFDQFHCVCCEKLMPRAEAEILFKTGYYRRAYRLGYCHSCAVPQEEADSGNGLCHQDVVSLPAERRARDGAGFIGRSKILTA